MGSGDSSPIETRLRFAVEIARQGGAQSLSLFRSTGLDVEKKSDGSPVTMADRQVEQSLRQAIGERFPQDAILGEEMPDTPGTSGYRWVLDPIDGTKSFVCGVPLYTTLVAVLEEDRPVIGVIFAPAAQEMVYAGVGLGCWHIVGESSPQEARVSGVTTLAESTFVTTSVRSFQTDRTSDCRQVYQRLQDACRLARTWGDAYGYLLVATGRAEVMIDPKMNLWDSAVSAEVLAIVRESTLGS